MKTPKPLVVIEVPLDEPKKPVDALIDKLNEEGYLTITIHKDIDYINIKF